MIIIPNSKIDVIGSNIPEGSGSVTEWATGTYAENDVVKVTERAGEYVGKVYKSIKDGNIADP